MTKASENKITNAFVQRYSFYAKRDDEEKMVLWRRMNGLFELKRGTAMKK